MNEEIKQILDKATPYLFGDEVDKLLDYITNLQKKYENAVAEEIERLNNIINELEKILTEEYDYCDKHIDPAFGTGMGVAKRTLDKLKDLKDSD